MSSFNPSNNSKGQLLAQAFKFTDQATVAGANHWQLTLYDYDNEGRFSDKWIYTDPATGAPEVVYTYTATGAIDQINYKGSKDVDYGYTISGAAGQIAYWGWNDPVPGL